MAPCSENLFSYAPLRRSEGSISNRTAWAENSFSVLLKNISAGQHNIDLISAVKSSRSQLSQMKKKVLLTKQDV